MSETTTAQAMEKLQREVERAMQEKAPEQRQKPQFFPTPEPEPPPPDVCPTCLGQAAFKYDVPFGHQLWGKLFPCPDCEAGREAARKRSLRMFAAAQMPREYQVYRLAHFLPRIVSEVGLTDEKLEGKRLAVGLAWQFVHNKRWMSERAAYQFWCEMYTEKGFKVPPGWIKKANEAPDTSRNWLVLHGFNGTGKTALASAIANELIERGKVMLYLRVDDFIQVAQQTNKPDAETTELEVVQTARDATVLILDDMNVSKVTDYGRKIMEQVIRYRHNEGKPTIITLNASEAEFETEWHTRIASVVFSSAHWTPVAGQALRDERHSLDPF